MNRKTFIHNCLLGGAALAIAPQFSFSNISEFSNEELIGKGNPEVFGNGYSLRKEAYDAFIKMKAAALKENLPIRVVSSYRTYAHQNRIWERKYKRFTGQGLSPINAIIKIVEYSTIPGTSRHHWATDIDIVLEVQNPPKDVLLAKHFHNNGPFCKLKEWLDEHSESFGFHLVYTDNANRKGFKYEPWHFTYAPLSKKMLEAYRKFDVKTMLQKEKLMGSEHFTTEFIDQYIKENILDINPYLLE
ncbi:MAG: M15 family metallopeptidase [Flavobacteriaceae bacterium]|nr:M15 family metallopeptidase [Flavobacteriaceae bacterium]